jgi:hypothetical protein
MFFTSHNKTRYDMLLKNKKELNGGHRKVLWATIEVCQLKALEGRVPLFPNYYYINSGLKGQHFPDPLSKCYDFVTPLIVQEKCHHGESDIESKRTEQTESTK